MEKYPELNASDIGRMWDLLTQENEIRELRILNAGWRKTISGYYDNKESFVRDAANWTQQAYVKAVYITLNPCKPELMARAINKTIEKAEATTTDEQIVKRTNLIIDIDPVSPVSGISATANERELALTKTEVVEQYLSSIGFPCPLVISSGNGGSLTYRVDLPNDKESLALVKTFLEALSKRFTDATAKVDVTVCNAARICKIAGTIAKKGEHTIGAGIEDRPHRTATILSAPMTWDTLSKEQIQDSIEMMGVIATEKPVSDNTANGRHTTDSVEKLMTEKGMSFGPAKQYETSTKWQLDVCPWGEHHASGSKGDACIYLTENGFLTFSCSHNTCKTAGHDIKGVFGEDINSTSKGYADSVVDSVVEPFEGGKTKTDEPKPKKQQRAIHDIAIDMVTKKAELWMSQYGAFATVTNGDHTENYDLRSESFKEWIVGEVYDKTGKAMTDASIKTAINVLKHKAKSGETQKVYHRVARLDKAIYIDLGDDAWHCVEIKPDGWRVIKNPPVKFKRSGNMAAMPLPKPGGDINDLKKLCGCSDDGWVLTLGFILDALKGEGPYMIAVVNGEQGSAKTSLCEIVRSLIDPLKLSPLSSCPQNSKDLCIDAQKEYLLAYDNVSFLHAWLQDDLCKAATGGGIKSRTLYTDDEQTVIPISAPVILNGIPDFSTANDLLDRSVLIRQPAVENRIEKKVLVAEFNEKRAEFMGWLYSFLVNGLNTLDQVESPQVRMSDSAKWVTACFGDERFLQTYISNRQEATELGLQSSPVACAIINIAEHGRFSGTASELLDRIKDVTHDYYRISAFPANAQSLTNRLKRDMPALRQIGFNVQQRKTNGRKLWVVERICE